MRERESDLEREGERERQRENTQRKFEGEKITKNVLREKEVDRQRLKRGRYFPHQENCNQRGRKSVFFLSLDLCHLK